MATNQSMNYEIPPEMRDFAEKSVDQARKALDGFLGAAHKAVETLEGSTSSLQANATEATRKTLSYAEQNIAAAFEHAQRLVRARDMQEALSIQTEFARNQFAAMQTQLKDLGELAQSAARSATSQATSAATQAASSMRSATEDAAAEVNQNVRQATSGRRRSSES
jgi:phasin